MTRIWVWTVLSLKQLSRARFYFILVLAQPLFFVAVTAWLSRGRADTLATAVAGTTVMGMWSITLFGSGRALQRERRGGTLELLLVAPMSLFRPLFAVSLSAAVLGLLSAASAVIAVTVFFGQPLEWAHLGLFAVALSAGVVGIAVLGVLLSVMFVLLRQASMLTNMLEYPVWFACALMVPADARPTAVAWFGELLLPTHLGTLLGEAITAGTVDAAAAGKLLVLAVAYTVLAVALLRRVSVIVRRRGDLAIV